MTKYAIVENGSWTGETTENPRDLAESPIPYPAKIRDFTRHGFYPIRERRGNPADYEKRVGWNYNLDTDRAVMEKVAVYENKSIAEYGQDVAKKAKEKRQYHAQKPVNYGGNVFDADPKAQQKLTGKLSYAAATGKDSDSSWEVGWKTADNGFTKLSYSDLKSLVGAVNEQVQQSYNREGEIGKQIKAATSIEDLRMIYVDAGWPLSSTVQKPDAFVADYFPNERKISSKNGVSVTAQTPTENGHVEIKESGTQGTFSTPTQSLSFVPSDVYVKADYDLPENESLEVDVLDQSGNVVNFSSGQIGTMQEGVSLSDKNVDVTWRLMSSDGNDTPVLKSYEVRFYK